MTKQQALENHRKMWHWIADETLRQKRKVDKREYFEAMRIPIDERPISECYCCEYAKNIESNGSSYCSLCPVEWLKFYSEKELSCIHTYALYNLWCHSYCYETAAKYARKIAELPEEKGERYGDS